MVVLRIGRVPELSLPWLQAFLGALQHHHVSLTADLLHLRTSEQLRRLRAGELDLAIVHDPGLDGDFEREPVVPGEPLAVFLPLGHRLAPRTELSAADLRREDLVLVPAASDPALGAGISLQLDRAGCRFRSRRETSGEDARDVLFAVTRGAGVTVGPWSMLRAAGEAGTILLRRALEPPLRMPDTVLAWLADPVPPPGGPVAAARQAAREVYAAAVEEAGAQRLDPGGYPLRPGRPV